MLPRHPLRLFSKLILCSYFTDIKWNHYTSTWRAGNSWAMTHLLLRPSKPCIIEYVCSPFIPCNTKKLGKKRRRPVQELLCMTLPLHDLALLVSVHYIFKFLFLYCAEPLCLDATMLLLIIYYTMVSTTSMKL